MLSSRMGLPSSVTAMAPAVCSARKSVSVAPLLASRRGRDGKHIDDRAAFWLTQPLDPLDRIDHRNRVRHGADRSESARRSGGRAGRDRLFVRLAGFAQVHVQIDEAGRDDESAGIEFLIRAAFDFVGSRNFGNAAIFQQHVHGRVDARRRVDEVAAFNQQTSSCFLHSCHSCRRLFPSHLPHGPRQNRHARGHAVAHFLQDARLSAVGNFAGQFQAANNRAGMHHHGIFFRHLQTGRVHLVACDVFREIDLHPGKALGLHAQQHDHIGAAQCVFNVAGYAHAGREGRGNVGHQFRRTAKNNLHAEFAEQMTRRPRHAAVKDVADNRDLQTFESFLVAQNCVRIEQRLRRMLVQSVSGVDDGHVEVLRHQVGSAGVGMANDDDVGAHRAHGVSRIEERFALFNTRTDGLDEDGVSAHHLGRDFKRAAGAGGGLVEKKKHALALEQGRAACPDSCAGQTSRVSGSRLLPGARCRAGNRALDS